MSVLRTDVIEAVRSMAREGSPPSEMLREIITRMSPESADQQLLVRYFSEAFHFTEGQAYSIFGWHPDGRGEVADSTLDYLLSKHMQETRSGWAN
jgi:hypothetical protein